jgi:hypothetical protein
VLVTLPVESKRVLWVPIDSLLARKLAGKLSTWGLSSVTERYLAAYFGGPCG